jgi:branched-chain amino acid transport system permease protein
VIARTDLPTAAALVMAFVVPALVSGAVGLPLMRLRAAYFSVASLGIALAAQAWMLNWDWTGASTGLNMPLSSYVPPERQYVYAVGLLVGVLGVVMVIVRSGLGLRLMALRDDEEAAADIGIRRLPVAMTTWMLSGGLTGLAGALVALQKSSLEPVSAFSITFTLDMIVAAVIGGLSTIAGPIVGAILVYVIRQALQDYASWSTLINGLLIVAVIRFAPGGIVELCGRALRSVLPSRSVEDSAVADTTSQERTQP